jgi:hypothetical protein
MCGYNACASWRLHTRSHQHAHTGNKQRSALGRPTADRERNGPRLGHGLHRYSPTHVFLRDLWRRTLADYSVTSPRRTRRAHRSRPPLPLLLVARMRARDRHRLQKRLYRMLSSADVIGLSCVGSWSIYGRRMTGQREGVSSWALACSSAARFVFRHYLRRPLSICLLLAASERPSPSFFQTSHRHP